MRMVYYSKAMSYVQVDESIGSDVDPNSRCSADLCDALCINDLT